MKPKENKLVHWIRIVLAVAGKDVQDALKNRVTISIILGVFMVVLSTQARPLLLKLQPEKTGLVYDPARSTFVEEYGKGESYRLVEISSKESMLDEIGGISTGAIGLALSGNFAERLDGNEPLEIEAYYSSAMKASEVDEMVTFFSREFSDALGHEVVLLAEGNETYPRPDSGGHPFLVRTSLAIAILTVGLTMVPLLMIEEKERHTIDVLLVSPASYSQIVLGKALAGIFYCMTAAVVVYAINFRLLANGWVALLAVLAASLFTVGLGLLLGMLFEQPANMNLVIGLLVILLMVPILLSALAASAIPPALQTLLHYMPSVAMGKLFGMSFSNLVDTGALLFNLAVLFGIALILLLLVVWRVRRMDR